MNSSNDKDFRRDCGSKLHTSDLSNFKLIDLKHGKKVSKKDRENLLTLEVIKPRTRFICDHCFQSAKESVATDDDGLDYELYKKITDVGSSLQDAMKADISKLKGSPLRDIPEALSYDPLKWIINRPEMLVHLVSSVCNVDLNTADTDQLTLFSKIIELIYSCKNSKIVLPNHFLENLMCYTYTNCKTYLNFMGSRSPGGAYTYLSNWLKELSKDPLEFPIGLVKSVFDNSQKVGKTYLISGTNIVPTSVITSHLWITLDKNNAMQNDDTFSPSKWMLGKNLNDDQCKTLLESLTNPSEKFRETRNIFLSESINIVNAQINDESHEDFIDEKLKQLEIISARKVCIWCKQTTNQIEQRICRTCGGKLVKEAPKDDEEHVNIEPYASFVNQENSIPHIECMAGEPDFLNPSGYENIIIVLQAIGRRAGIKHYGSGTREWLFVECDGLPYNLIRDILINVLRCEKCKNVIMA